MDNLEKIEKIKSLFKEGVELLKSIEIEDKDEIEDIVSNFGKYDFFCIKCEEGGIFSQLNYIKEDIENSKWW